MANKTTQHGVKKIKNNKYLVMYNPQDSEDIDWILEPEQELLIRKYNLIKVEDIQKHQQQFGMQYVFKLIY